ncbi:MAG: thrombospondin type 3 repeat-containing protein, partial [Muribaculaceae bacterium]|nr:thrombospondin type 3 repeat-containing protein [Muribaculaceae bacterium]
AAPVDSDGDGMPDAWEEENGLDPQNANDRNLTDAEGFTNLERYLNSLVEHITKAQNEGGVLEGIILEPEPVEESYEISALTADATRTSFGYGMTIANMSGGSYNVRNEYFGVGRDQQHIVSLPIGAAIKWIKVTGYPRYAGANYDDASLVELNGAEYAAGVHALTKAASEASPETFEVTLSEPAENTLTMTWKGNNPWMKMWLFTTESAGIEDVAADRSELYADDPDAPWFNLQGMRVAEPLAPGIYIRNGRKHLVR